MTQNDEIIRIVVDDGIMTSFISINSTTASPETAELLLSVCTALSSAAIIPAAAAQTDIPSVYISACLSDCLFVCVWCV